MSWVRTSFNVFDFKTDPIKVGATMSGVASPPLAITLVPSAASALDVRASKRIASGVARAPSQAAAPPSRISAAPVMKALSSAAR